ncbi:MAG: prepilin-type N-terminal cleavage/methylation domain-containing protein [Verrucomicrobia bacterium]|nr:prepilin-type N-terminal cleavage/methylation domain-containing protein [Verrucomicrobiota bacterium]
MNLFGHPISNRPHGSNAARKTRGFTIPEIMITMTIVLLIMAAVITCHLIGLRMFEMTKAKLGASDDARRAISSMITEIRSAKFVRVGEGDLAAFKEIGVDTPKIGSAIQVYPSNDTNTWIRYFWDASDQKIKRASNGMTTATIVASAVSNQMVFLGRRLFRKTAHEQRPGLRHRPQSPVLPTAVSHGLHRTRELLRLLPTADTHHPPGTLKAPHENSIEHPPSGRPCLHPSNRHHLCRD